MEANELRINNWIYEVGIDYTIDNPFPDINDLTLTLVNLKVLENILNFNYTTDFPLYQPIPLTEEILLKCGFEKIKDKHVFFIAFMGRWHFLDLSGIEPRYNMGDNSDGKIQIPILYLHQLQNLYFALTNQELEVNL